ncbi:MAG: hemerythrin domain-containing protein [Candidatus Omnitrophica bacterium]|nr:hemerythrin domain-containing protein [Candidatus Omnitrophota bacterium]
MRYFKILLFILCFLGGSGVFGYADINRGTPSKFMRHEHDQLHARIERLAKAPGKTGEVAKKLLMVMRPHMFNEEEFVLPELGVLKKLAFGESMAGMTWVIGASEKLKEKYPQMLVEHKAILLAVDELKQAAELEGDQTALDLAAHLKAHIQDEEDVIYPAAILAGQYIKKNYSKG